MYGYFYLYNTISIITLFQILQLCTLVQGVPEKKPLRIFRKEWMIFSKTAYEF